MNFNALFTTAYRWLAIKFLAVIFTIAFCYAFLVAFFALSDSWAVPIVLSPSQERVLAFQPQIATLQATQNKQKIELATAQATVTELTVQVQHQAQLLSRMDKAIDVESAQLAGTGVAINKMLTDKRSDIAATTLATAAVQQLLKQVDTELASNLITADQAAQRRISLQSALNASTDAKAQAIQLTEQARQFQSGASTLKGGSSSLTAMITVKQAADLRALKAQTEIQLATATATIEALTQSIAETTRVLNVAKSSPYYRALRESVSVAFVPYENNNMEVGEPVYDCFLKILFCRKVGTVTTLYEAEEYARHPLFKTDLKGRFIGVEFTDAEAAKSQVVFIGGKPLFL